nr:hypothetical protein [Alkalihalobacillus deserti]
MKDLVEILEKIGANEYAAIEKKYGEEIWRLFMLEHDEVKEEEFYSMIEKADNEYHQLHGKLEQLLQAYFINIHTELIEVVED